MGDPAGIGPELCLRVLRDRTVLAKCRPVIFADAGVLLRVARRCGLPSPGRTVTVEDWLAGKRTAASAQVVDCRAIESGLIMPGRISAACGSASYRYIEAAVIAALAGRISGIATAPINKKALNLAGIKYAGHTEILAYLTGAKKICMMMASDRIKVSLATIHTAVKKVPAILSRQCITDAIELTVAAMKRLGIKKPRIAVCALNPHGGENGMFGTEERRIIEPAIRVAQKKGLKVTGPVVPDTAFVPEKRRETDAYVVMYHDQGLIPFKMLAFDCGVNITLGLPIVRTSVDHGTAFDIAWHGKASPNSLVQAVLWAVRLSRHSCPM